MPPSASPEEEFPDNLWFLVETNKAKLFQKAVRSLTLSAVSDRYYVASAATGIMSISETDGVLLASVNTMFTSFTTLWLPSSSFTLYNHRESRLLHFDLRHFEHRLTTTLGAYDCHEHASIRFSGDSANDNTLIYGFKDGGGLETSEIALTHWEPGCLPGNESTLEDCIQLTIEMPAWNFILLINFLSLHGTEVSATVTNTQIMFYVVNKEDVLRTEEAGSYQIVHSEGQYPYELEFNLDQRTAVLNAACLSDKVRLHKLIDSRTVLEMPITGLGSLMFSPREII